MEMLNRGVTLLALLLTATATLSATLFAEEREPTLKILFLGDNGHHAPGLRSRQLIPAMAKRGIEVTYTDKLEDLNAKTLAAYDGLIIYANHEKISPEQETALLEYVAAGHGIIPLHCASFCFLNSDKYIELVGAQFQKHGTGTFCTQIAKPDHPLMRGFSGFESWDETYVHHKHNEKDRVILETRAEGDRQEPWTWVRTHGKGRVFYTAWGHDERTWAHPGFVNLVERGIRWACGDDELKGVPEYRERPAFVTPKMTPPRRDVKPFEYVEVGPKIPNYTRGGQWGAQGKPITKMQLPLSPEESLKHFVVPEGFHVELFAAEPDLGGKPIAMNWDERGRLWVCETVDYPNELQKPGEGRDRIRICEDTDGDWKADKFTVFAEKLSIPTAIAFARGGAIVQDGTQTVFLKDTDGDDKADVRKALVTGWGMGDTHGGVSNFRYGLDNWYWGMQGYNESRPRYGVAVDGRLPQQSQPFRMGFFRFKLDQQDPPNVIDLEFIRSTNNNTWGLGFSEEGLVFGSTANGNPSVYMPIPNRYYERVRGWAPQQLGGIADSDKFQAITENVRQVDHFNGYTAGAGHALYTARRYPQTWWNRTAFVCEPTGHLVGTFVLSPKGADFTSTSPLNLLASDDEWSAPIMAEVGPDGCVWVLDWYNYIIQHNPTPQGFKTGRGNAYESDLRDKKHGRVYRVVYGDEIKPIRLNTAKPEELVAALKSDNMLWRLHAQRLLVERGKQDILDALIKLARDAGVDELDFNAGAVHALWTMRELPADKKSDAPITSHAESALKNAMIHASPGVRMNAIRVLHEQTGKRWNSPDLVEFMCDRARSLEDRDAQVRLAAFLTLADHSAEVVDVFGADGWRTTKAIVQPHNYEDRWILDAATSALNRAEVPAFDELAKESKEIPSVVLARLSIVAESFARGKPSGDTVTLFLDTLAYAQPPVVDAVVAGLAKGWPHEYQLDHYPPRNPRDNTLSESGEKSLKNLLDTAPASSKARLLKLSVAWGSNAHEEHAKEIVAALTETISNDEQPADKRIAAGRQLVEFKPDDQNVIELLIGQITLQTEPEVAHALIEAVGLSRSPMTGEILADRMAGWTPQVRAVAIRVLLSRPESTKALLKSVEDGQSQLTDLSLDQKQSLAAHPDKEIAALAKKLLERGGGLPNADRQKVLEELLPLAEKRGDAALGKEVFKKQCAKCHTHSGEGTRIGPDLTGMAVHPKAELLGHVIDPSKSVEGNFRVYSLVTADGVVLSGMLAGESKTALELIDTEAKRHNVLREDIDTLVASPKSLMPEGFEKQLSKDDVVNLLEFLTQRGKYVPLDLARVATIVSTRGMFYDENADPERLIFDDWKPKEFEGVPFLLVDPQGERVPNVVMLHGPEGKFPPRMPKSVTLPVGSPAKAIHLLSGVSGWGFPAIGDKSVSMIVRLHYADGKAEDHELRNAVHFADYIRRVDVPESKLAFMLRGQQIRYLAVHPQRAEQIDRVELVKGEDRTAPVVMAITVESRDEERGSGGEKNE
jgi:putative membrane-bound dehydrogenase-like protein